MMLLLSREAWRLRWQIAVLTVQGLWFQLIAKTVWFLCRTAGVEMPTEEEMRVNFAAKLRAEGKYAEAWRVERRQRRKDS